MRKLTLFFLLVFVAKTNFAKSSNLAADTIKSIEIVENQILYDNKPIANIKSEKVSTSDGKNVKYLVSVYHNEGKEVAKFEIEVSSKVKKKEDAVKYAQLTTLKDNVVHNGSNFIDYHMQLTEAVLEDEKAPQIAKMVDYLIENKYLPI